MASDNPLPIHASSVPYEVKLQLSACPKELVTRQKTGAWNGPFGHSQALSSSAWNQGKVRAEAAVLNWRHRISRETKQKESPQPPQTSYPPSSHAEEKQTVQVFNSSFLLYTTLRDLDT